MCRDHRQVAGWVRLHSPVYRWRSHLPPGTRGEENQGAQNRARAEQRRPHFPPGNTEAGGKGGPQVLLAEPRGGTPQLDFQKWSVRTPVPFAYPPGSPKTLGWSPELRWPGGTLGVPRSASHSAHQLARNSPTPGLLQSSCGRGSRRGAGRTIAVREGGERAAWACRTRAERKEQREAAAQGSRLSAADTEEVETGHAARRGSRAAVSAEHPLPPAATRWRSPAPRPASGGSAAELERGRRRGRFSS